MKAGLESSTGAHGARSSTTHDISFPIIYTENPLLENSEEQSLATEIENLLTAVGPSWGAVELWLI